VFVGYKTYYNGKLLLLKKVMAVICMYTRPFLWWKSSYSKRFFEEKKWLQNYIVIWERRNYGESGENDKLEKLKRPRFWWSTGSFGQKRAQHPQLVILAFVCFFGQVFSLFLFRKILSCFTNETRSRQTRNSRPLHVRIHERLKQKRPKNWLSSTSVFMCCHVTSCKPSLQWNLF